MMVVKSQDKNIFQSRKYKYNGSLVSNKNGRVKNLIK